MLTHLRQRSGRPCEPRQYSANSGSNATERSVAAIDARCNPQSGIARLVGRSRRGCPFDLRSSMEKHDVADHTEAEDYRREPHRFDEV